MSEPLPAVVLPSSDDPVVRSGSEGLGGPAGRRVRSGATRAVVIALILTTLTCVLALVAKAPCRAQSWNGADNYTHLCYSDIAFLYRLRAGLADGHSPYATQGDQSALEYPVLTGAFMAAAAWVTNHVWPDQGELDRSRDFFDVTVLMLVVCALATTWLIAKTAGRRPWDALLFALAPGLLLTAYINWDLFAVALTAGFGLAWARRHPALAGVLLGLAIAAKFYPVVLFGPLLVLCLRAGKMRAFAVATGAALAAWLVVNLPVRMLWPDGWATFYSLSRDRGAGFGSIWYALDREGHTIPDGQVLNRYAAGSLLVLCLGIAALALLSRRRPRLAQLAFLVVAAFAITNKVYSPQYVLWMLALFPLARPRWRDLLIWQAGEAAYFVAIWWHLQGLADTSIVVPEWTHTYATVLRIAATLWVCAMIVRDILRPDLDPVRAGGVDDPTGGVLDHAPDAFSLLGGTGAGAQPAGRHRVGAHQ
jgi:uncharacterized membrane protein